MEYVVGFIFNWNMKKVLMIYRKKEPYRNKFNGVGGKVKPNETPLCAFLRETEEETGIDLTKEAKRFKKLVTMSYPSGVTLHVFYAVLKDDFKMHVVPETNEGVLTWYPVKEGKDTLLDVTSRYYAGEGNIPYFINYALMIEDGEV